MYSLVPIVKIACCVNIKVCPRIQNAVNRVGKFGAKKAGLKLSPENALFLHIYMNLIISNKISGIL